MSKGREWSASFWEESGDRRHISALSIKPWWIFGGASSELGGEVGGGLGEEDEDRGVVRGSLWDPLLQLCEGTGAL